MSSRFNYIGELVLIKGYNYYTHVDKTYLGIVDLQYSRLEVRVRILNPERGDPFQLRVRNDRNPPTFQASPNNNFYILNEKRHEQ